MSDLNFLEYVFQKGLQPLNTLLFDEQVFRYHHRHKEYQKFLSTVFPFILYVFLSDNDSSTNFLTIGNLK